MNVGPGMKVLGWVFLIAAAVGFEIENPWVFLGAVVLGLGWLGAILTGAHNAHLGDG